MKRACNTCTVILPTPGLFHTLFQYCTGFTKEDVLAFAVTTSLALFLFDSFHGRFLGQVPDS